ncbi:hypothetical protein Gmet_3590 [Geobacter metallireducens GS-15]|uniref:Uncharacterized protein n=1 Tax=Geobacter metallireducens (strain ATCC 53774 / DSM 7210 / GS-15) TaxID=269799 RepID=J7LW88_GEOMG|nr:hypothetical protein Gmet_3590 [Geobacter metallireducens GS-15]
MGGGGMGGAMGCPGSGTDPDRWTTTGVRPWIAACAAAWEAVAAWAETAKPWPPCSRRRKWTRTAPPWDFSLGPRWTTSSSS